MGPAYYCAVHGPHRQLRLLPSRAAQDEVDLPYFSPSWILLALSIYQGTKLQGSYVAYLMAALRKETDPQRATIINSIVAKVNTDVLLQIRYLEVALLCLALWAGYLHMLVGL